MVVIVIIINSINTSSSHLNNNNTYYAPITMLRKLSEFKLGYKLVNGTYN